MHTTVFEYGYVTSDKAACVDLGAKLISKRAFEYLKEVSLSAGESDTNKCLGLTKRFGYELLQVKNYVGVLFTPTGEHIEVLPKTGRKSATQEQAILESREMLLMMLQHLGSFRYLTSNQANIASKQMPLLETFIEQFLQSVNTLVKRGLKSDYVMQEGNLHFQKGKLKVSQQIRHNAVNQHKFYVEYDEYQINRPANRLLKTALLKLTNYTRLAANQKLLRELQFAFIEVPTSKSVEQDITALKLDRGMTDYHGPLAWAKLILEGFSPLSMKGDHGALSLLFPMEAVFESYVASVLRSQLVQGAQLTTQASSRYLVKHNSRSQFQLRPDLMITCPENQTIVLDTKWKLLDMSAHNFGLSQSDFYQMFAYGHKYQSGKGELVLIYPAHDGFTEAIEHSFDFGDELKLWVVPFVLEVDGNSRLHFHENHELRKLINVN
ncbi:McrC family protein [Vibrio breoganii]|uniref:McrC family protein n=1 Tax=Vibrio breoganii TaxID=553239 RepID=UPI000C84214F|nr:McrC family protein [Vibrio breoganii]PMJ44298.1 restriction endonuclease [Vibrio breoganii]PMK59421.1 restriction endonuclease [Vibrio breoganii]PMM86766.1 restriction endonuclease [Vibrio breoganii]PMO29220.1 restriction endonuclease [Vibrio breoganii]PMO32944.1 restriction endonuclease [Vibrio breoganii]